MKTFFIYCLISLSLIGCSRAPLQVYTKYIGVEDLASYYVNTPDPMLANPNVGQRLVVSWSVPYGQWGYNELTIKISMRYGNREQVQKSITIGSGNDTYEMCLLNQDYFDVCGIQSYKVELFGDGVLIEERRHQMWADLIEIGGEDKKA